MSRKHLTFDDRLAIQTGLQQGMSAAQIAKNIGKDRSTVGREIKAHRRLVASSKGNNCVHHDICTGSPNAGLSVLKENVSARAPAEAVSRAARTTRRNSAGSMNAPLLSAMPVTIACAAASAGCFMTQSTPRNSMSPLCQNPEKESLLPKGS